MGLITGLDILEKRRVPLPWHGIEPRFLISSARSTNRRMLQNLCNVAAQYVTFLIFTGEFWSIFVDLESGETGCCI